MSAVTTHERPGVYSVYTAAPAAVSSYRGGTAALAAQSSQGTEGTVYTLTSQTQAAEIFGAGDAITVLAGVMLRNGARKVYAVPVRPAEEADQPKRKYNWAPASLPEPACEPCCFRGRKSRGAKGRRRRAEIKIYPYFYPYEKDLGKLEKI